VPKSLLNWFKKTVTICRITEQEAQLSLRRPIVLRTMSGIAAQNRTAKNAAYMELSHGHVTTTSMAAIPDAEIYAVCI